jgi:hypothetical protein
VLILTQDGCTICVERTAGLEMILDALDGTPRWCGSYGISFWSILETVLVSVQDRCTICAEHTIGSEIILDASDGTPR